MSESHGRLLVLPRSPIPPLGPCSDGTLAKSAWHLFDRSMASEPYHYKSVVYWKSYSLRLLHPKLFPTTISRDNDRLRQAMKSASQCLGRILEKSPQDLREASDEGLNYQYQPLKSRTDIRLLTLSCGARVDPISCSLRTYTLADAPAFDAVSYVWGSTAKTICIWCNNQRLFVTENLHEVLLQLSRAESPNAPDVSRSANTRLVLRTFWIDQICIDQSNENERGHQVALMSRIYAQARMVIACLGRSVEAGFVLSKFLQSLNTWIELEVETRGNWRLAAFRLDVPSSVLCEPGLAILDDIFASAFFRRKWIVQELGLANKPVVLVGMSKVRWSIMLECAAYLKHDLGVRQKFGSQWARDIHHGTLMGWGSKSKRHLFIESNLENSNFLEILDQARCLDASDARDRIYAFLGHPLAHLGDGAVIMEPDYTVDVQSCLYSFAKQWILKTGDLTILSMVWTPDEESIISWVPTWEYQSCYQSLSLGAHRNFNASGSMCSTVEPRIESNLLFVSGVLLDEVRATYPLWDPRQYIDAWHSVRSLRHCFTAGKTSMEAFVQALSTLDSPNAEGVKWQRAFTSRFFSDVKGAPLAEEMSTSDLQSMSEKYAQCIKQVSYGRMFMLTRRRKTKATIMGLVPQVTYPGDICCVVANCKIPLVLRPHEVPSILSVAAGQSRTAGQSRRNPPEVIYKVVGEAYLYGYMYGAVLEDIAQGRAKVVNLTLC